ncbi:MAG: nodulation protein NfeD [Candidatus Promineifilaceae bacterium]|nr:nodulation protein NfeD [Candidatus Promineifilaceae bacterium]
MSRRLFPRFVLALVPLLLLWLAAGPVWAQEQGDVIVLEAEGPVTPAMASYFERGVDAGEEGDAAAVLIILDTPGGGLETTQEIIRLFRNASVPVIVYVGPAGVQAASAGSLLTLAAHASGMAPETVIGAASPVSGGGEDIGDTLYRKVVEDLKAQVRSLAERRGEEAVALAEAMIEEARAVHAGEALDAGLIDAVSDDAPGLLDQLDGQSVIVNGQEQVLRTAEAQRTPREMNVIERALHALSNPTLVSILLAIAVPSILIELRSPGGWVAGFVGVVSLALAFYGLGQLPVNWFGLLLIGAAFVLFLMEVHAPGVGALAIVGALSLFAGMLVLFNSPGSPEFARISIPVAVAITATTSGFFLFLLTMALRAQREQPLTGKEGLIGRTGRVRKTFVPAPSGSLTFAGSVLVHGEIWQAEAEEAVKTGEKVVVTGAEGFTLRVEREAGADEVDEES